MFDLELSNNPATALTVGTAGALTFSLQSPASPGGQSIRSVSAVATTAPHTLKIGHSTRLVKNMRYTATKASAPDVIIDRHLIRVDKVIAAPTWGLSDPNYGITTGAQLVVEVPRLGATDTPSTQMVMDQILRVIVALNPTSNAGLLKLLNNEI